MMGLVWGYMAPIGCKYRSGADIIHHNQLFSVLPLLIFRSFRPWLVLAVGFHSFGVHTLIFAENKPGHALYLDRRIECK